MINSELNGSVIIKYILKRCLQFSLATQYIKRKHKMGLNAYLFLS
jgi:hypothetical protein